MLETFKKWALLVIIGGGIFALDQWVKTLVVENLRVGETWNGIPAIAGLIRITRSSNTGAAFGMFPNASDFFLALAFITILAFIISYPRLPSHAGLSRISIALISGGALSNAYDRLRLNYVVDYVHVQLSPTLSNISNLADHAITVGVALLLIDQWRAERRELADRQAAEAQSGQSEAESQPERMALDNPALSADDSAGSLPAAGEAPSAPST